MLSSRYDAYTNLGKRIGQVDFGAHVQPFWTERSDCFWFRKRHSIKKSSFVLVDVIKSKIEPAFDHDRLAQCLRDQGIDAVATKLPFRRISYSDDMTSVRFRAGDKKWQWSITECKLAEYDGDLHSELLTPLEAEKASECDDGEKKVSIGFINQTRRSLGLFWIDYKSKAIFYETLGPKATSQRQTYQGHVWRVVESKTDKVIAYFEASDKDTEAIISEDLAAAAKPLKETQKPQESKSVKPLANADPQHDSSKLVIRDYNVSVRDKDDKGEVQLKQLTTNGTADNAYDIDSSHISADKRYAVSYQYQPAEQHKAHTIESSPEDQLHPRLKSFQYLRPGHRTRTDRPRLFDLQEMREVSTSDELFKNPYHILNFDWSSDDSEFLFIYNERGHKVLRLLGMNRAGEVRKIIEEKSETFIDWSYKLCNEKVKGTNELIWMSERDGWNHLYLYDISSAQLKNQVTKGEWVVTEVDHIDEERRQVWFEAKGLVKEQDPYYAHLARVNFDGSDLKVLTEGDGTHTWNWSPDKKFFVDSWSRVDLPPQIAVRDADTGKSLLTIQSATFNPLHQIGWTTPERFDAPGRDGKTRIYGIIITSSNLDPSKKYPVIEDIYAGPQQYHVPKSFDSMWTLHALAELGFIVVLIDGMGTNWRGKAFHDVCYKNLKDAGFPDRIAWMKAAAEDRPWMDLARVGIVGGSAGGQNALAALLWHGDFYKAAVADCGCHDNRIAKQWWNELYMGWPVDGAYEDNSNVVHAGKLKGALMLIVGELDDNVDPACTMQVVRKLNEKEKDYELLYLPGEGHGVGLSSSYARRRWAEFFIKELLGEQPPKRNAEN